MSEILKLSDEDIAKGVDNSKIVITDAEKEAFFKCFLADKSYQETVKLFGGRLTLTFKTLTMAENELIFNQIKKDQQDGVAADDDAYFIKISSYRLGMSLIKMNDQPFQAQFDEKAIALLDTNESIVKLRSKVFESWPTFKLTGVIDGFRYFEQKVLKLTAEVRDVNFWEAAKLSS